MMNANEARAFSESSDTLRREREAKRCKRFIALAIKQVEKSASYSGRTAQLRIPFDAWHAVQTELESLGYFVHSVCGFMRIEW